MSVITRSRTPTRSSASTGSRSPARTTGRGPRFVSREKVSPTSSPEVAAVSAERKTPPAVVSSVPTLPSDGPPPRYGRKAASLNGSTPSRRSVMPGTAAVVTKPSMTGAASRRPTSRRIRLKTAASTPVGPPITMWVARPATVVVDASKAARELWIARSRATTTATPSATPSTESASWVGCFRR